MHFKLIIAFIEDSKTDAVMEAAREAGATGCTVISQARGEGVKESKTPFCFLARRNTMTKHPGGHRPTKRGGGKKKFR